jgi:hypothetical protein
MRRPLLHRIQLSTLATLLAAATLRAQSVGGYAASYLRREIVAREISMGGTFVPFMPGGSAIFSNSAALPGLDNPTAIASLSILPNGQRLNAFGFGMPIGGAGGVSAGLMSYGVSDIQGYTADERPLGTIGSSELAFSVGGGLTIGPGSLGATIRYLHSSISGTDGNASGYTVDLSGALALDERYFFSLALNNVAGEMKGPREIAPWNTRFGAAWLLPMEERTETSRLDPSGITRTRKLRPRAYLLLATEMRLAQYDSTPGFGFAGEWVPAVDFPVGIRAGFNTRGDISAGFGYDVPVDFVDALRLEVAARRDFELGDITTHVTITAAFGSPSRR